MAALMKDVDEEEAEEEEEKDVEEEETEEEEEETTEEEELTPNRTATRKGARAKTKMRRWISKRQI